MTAKRTPNAETIAAIEEAQEGHLKRFDTVKALFEDLNVKSTDECLTEINTLVATAKANGQAYVGVPVAELEIVLADLTEITPSEAGAMLAAVRHDNEAAEVNAAKKGRKK